MPQQPWAPAQRPLVFAHRGGSRLAPENTLAAFDRGVREGADGLELDVRLSADGEVVVCHDPRIDRTTDGKGAIGELTAAQLARVDAGFHFVGTGGDHPYRAQGFGIPTLREVVARHPGHPLIIELKDATPRLAEGVLHVVRRAGALERVCLGSFHLPVLKRVRELAPRVATSAGPREVRMALYRSWVRLFPRRVAYRALQVPERREGTRVVTPAFVRGAHRAGVPVQVWVVDREEDMRRLIGWGVDGLITDRPDVAVRVVGRQ